MKVGGQILCGSCRRPRHGALDEVLLRKAGKL